MGRNAYGQTGTNRLNDVEFPILLKSPTFKSVARIESTRSTLVQHFDGSIYVTGDNSHCAYDETCAIIREPKKLTSIGRCTSWSSYYHVICVTPKNQIVAFGENKSGQIANCTAASVKELVPIVLPDGLKHQSVYAGKRFSAALSYNDTNEPVLHMWGTLPNSIRSDVPILIDLPCNYLRQMKVGANAIVFVCQDNRIYLWGIGYTNITYITNECQPDSISIADCHVVCMSQNRNVYGMGCNHAAQLQTRNSFEPKLVLLGELMKTFKGLIILKVHAQGGDTIVITTAPPLITYFALFSGLLLLFTLLCLFILSCRKRQPKALLPFHIIDPQELESILRDHVSIHITVQRSVCINISVARKTLHADHPELLYHEIEILSILLPHDNIVRVLCVASDRSFLVTHLEDHSSLFEYLQTRPKLSIEQKLKIFLGACKALQVCHMCNVMHRDVKSSNLLIGKNSTSVLCDFGHSMLVRPTTRINCCCYTTSVATDLLIKVPSFVGTKGLVSPEAANNFSCFENDIFALGIIAYELDCETPFTDFNQIEFPAATLVPTMKTHQLFSLAEWCSCTTRQERKSAAEMVHEVEKMIAALQHQELPDAKLGAKNDTLQPLV